MHFLKLKQKRRFSKCECKMKFYYLCLLSQALSSFSSALQSGQLGPLMNQFGLGEDVANAAAQGGTCNIQRKFSEK